MPPSDVPLILPERSSKSGIKKSDEWNRLKGAVESKQFAIQKDLYGRKWSDQVLSHYEPTPRQCLCSFFALLAIAVLAYSFFFEQWSIVDSLYFTTILVTTVGYGDITPVTPGGKLFTTMFALGGIGVLTLVLGVVGCRVVEAEISYTEKMKAKSMKVLETSLTTAARRRRARKERNAVKKENNVENVEEGDESLSRSYSSDSLDSMGSASTSSSRSLSSKAGHHPSDRSQRETSSSGVSEVLGLFSGFATVLAGGLTIGMLEDWGWRDAVYYCVVTATTVGLGDLHPTTTIAKWCAIIFVPIGVATMGYITGGLASYVFEKRREERARQIWSMDLKVEDIEALDEDKSEGVSELEYIKFMLVTMKKIDGSLFDELRAQFVELDFDSDGNITKQDLESLRARRMVSVKRKLELSSYKRWLKRQKRPTIKDTGIGTKTSD